MKAMTLLISLTCLYQVGLGQCMDQFPLKSSKAEVMEILTLWHQMDSTNRFRHKDQKIVLFGKHQHGELLFHQDSLYCIRYHRFTKTWRDARNRGRQIRNYFFRKNGALLGSYALSDEEAFSGMLADQIITYRLSRKDGFAMVQVQIVSTRIGPFQQSIDRMELMPYFPIVTR